MSSAKLVTPAEWQQRCADAEQEAQAARFLANHHREENVRLKQRVEELTDKCARLEVEMKEANELLAMAHTHTLELETEIDARDEEAARAARD